MVVEDSVRTRLTNLIVEARTLSLGNQYGQCVDPQQLQECGAWLTAAQNAVHRVISDTSAPYRKKADRLAEASHGVTVHNAVGELALVLSAMITDADAGMLTSIADAARAEAFDDFLDHALHYHKNGKKQEAGVIAGVVFEDSLRRICRKLAMPEKGEKLDSLISELASRGELTAVKAKRARAAADVRTKATHAQWNEFELEDVRSTIELTREIIEAKLA